MIKNYLKIAFRNLRKHRGFSLINILGLATGLAVCLLVILLVWDQKHYDRFHEHSERIYRIISDNGRGRFAASPPLLAVRLQQYPGIEKIARLKRGNRTITHNRQSISISSLYADSTFLDIFGFKLLAGNKETALARPYTAVITQKTARKLFGAENPLGKILTEIGSQAVTVTGVVKRAGYRSHLTFDVLFSYATLYNQNGRSVADWSNARDIGTLYYTYLLLGKQVEPARAEQWVAKTAEQIYADSDDPPTFQLQPITGIALGPRLSNQVSWNHLPGLVGYFLSGLALVILLAAGFNYVNLSIARSLQRAREVGVRKVVGAHRLQIISQFLAESILITLGALALAWVLLEGLLPAFNNLFIVEQFESQITPQFWRDWPVYLICVGFSLLAGIIAGLYPALYLSSYQPVNVLKAGFIRHTRQNGRFSFTIRRLLVVFQLLVTFVLLVSTVLIYRQSHYMLNGDYGFKTERLLIIDLDGASYQTLKNELQRLPGIKHIAAAHDLPADGSRYYDQARTDSLQEPVQTQLSLVDFDYLQTMDLKLLAKGNLTEETFESGQTVILNETAVKALQLGSPEAAVGQTITMDGESYRVAGVVQDYHVNDFTEMIPPAALRYDAERFNYGHALIKLRSDNLQTTIAAIEEIWQQLNPTASFEYHFFDELIEQRMAPYQDAMGVLGAGAFLAVLISCLGLLGMATYSTETRLKEIGIRKTQGAGVKDVVLLLSREYLIQIALAVTIGIPLAWIINNWWLQSFAYRVEFGFLTYAVSVALILLLTLATVGSQTIKAAYVNPAELLRYE